MQKKKGSISKGMIGGLAALYLFTHVAFAGPGNGNPLLKDYTRAEYLYNLDDPTEESDLEAINLFTRVADGGAIIPADIRIKSLLCAGNIHQGYNRFNQSKTLYHQAMGINSQSVQRKDFAYESFLYLGTAMYYTGIIDSARYYFEKASALTAGNGRALQLPEQDRLYNSLGVIYYESGNYLQAKNYFQTALNFISSESEQYRDFYNNIQSNTANCLLKLHFYDSSISIFKKLMKDNPGNKLVAQNLAHALLEKGLTDSALLIYERLDLPPGFGRIIARNEMGRIYLLKGNYKQAETYFAAAIDENKKLTGNVKNKEEALSYLYRSQLAFKSGFLNESLLWVNRALSEVHLSYASKSIYDFPSDVSASVSPLTFFQVLVYKAGLVYEKYKREGNKTHLFNASRIYLKAVELSRYILTNFDNDDARMFFIENSRSLFDDAVRTAYEASTKDESYLDDVLRIIESYKGNVLYQSLQDARQKYNSSLPEGLLERESDLKQLHAAYLTQLNQTTDEKEAAQINRRIASLQVEISRLQKSFVTPELAFFFNDENYSRPDYLESIRDKIDRQTLLLNYFISGNTIYLFYLSRTEAHVEKISVNESFHKQYRLYLSDIYRITDGVRFDGYARGNELYNVLIDPVYKVASKYKRWVIIPDEYLYYLPFDALSKNEDRESYLLMDHTISYHYSFNLLLNNEVIEPKISKSDSILGFAPFSFERVFQGSGAIQSLPYSDNEINLPFVTKYIRGRATKQNFTRNYARYRYIHLGTHASLSADSTNSWILFHATQGGSKAEKLYLHEIYNLNLHGTELVTLSACQTAAGESVSGEGLLSLSRAFLYAGSKGIVSTLYKTDDKVTAFLMNHMYRYLNQGFSVEEALRKSKIDLIHSEDINPKLKTANFWANFIYIGKIADQGSFTINNILFWTLSFLTLLACIYFVFNYSKRIKPDPE
jgi:CHAT domain-containing protein/tetratricopeptide (TPR) repeat protein